MNCNIKNNIKNIIPIFVFLIILFSNIFTLNVLANEEIKVTVNGKTINFDNPPVIKDSRTLVPLRKIFEELGAEIEWDNVTQTVFATKENILINLTIGAETGYIFNEKNERSDVPLEVPAQLIESRTYVPVRFIAESLGAKVNWNKETRTVEISENSLNTEKLYHEDGSLKYEGELSNGTMHGYGVYYALNGSRYEGNWVNGVEEGKGVYYFSTGDKYDGEWHEGKIEGQGVYAWTDGSVYEGQWKNFKMDGSGTLTLKNGDKYVGQFKDGKIVEGKVKLIKKEPTNEEIVKKFIGYWGLSSEDGSYEGVSLYKFNEDGTGILASTDLQTTAVYSDITYTVTLKKGCSSTGYLKIFKNDGSKLTYEYTIENDEGVENIRTTDTLFGVHYDMWTRMTEKEFNELIKNFTKVE
ncbi:copper amine oxidase N-terminal domain-containing protein [Abyssisolibacter fermentans]|uniref:copper amine oxidase N-terminal domain-containing protein n=1 Tax=Abyssisolibacter fermentans TaxID=1766203 RepID=UPI00082AF0C7|nr:copper amine oxidase N-terminal domain-containing protein [Abyssisolibacter fermentans]